MGGRDITLGFNTAEGEREKREEDGSRERELGGVCDGEKRRKEDGEGE